MNVMLFKPYIIYYVGRSILGKYSSICMHPTNYGENRYFICNTYKF